MDKHRAILLILVCTFLCLCFPITVTNSNGDEEEEQKPNQNTKAETSFWLWQKLKSFYSLYSKVGSPTSLQWEILKGAYSRFISPHLGFSEGGDEALRAEKDAAKSGNGNEKDTTSSEKDSQHQKEL